ncbi:GNAT family N-acetyltransferase [Nocardia sp. NPDC050712]|uniref:GNAT family N-acetyltransferase n=1 Tax=Nocardia sp. NPDC050712 TaxID=3155518 RepID=UPI0033CB0864
MNPTGTPHALPRELTDIPDAVRRVPAPVLPTFEAPFTLRPAGSTDEDAALITEWMSRPLLVQTWEQDMPLAWRQANLAAQLAGTYSLPCVLGYDFTAADRPDLGRREVGYVELYRAAKDEISTLYHAHPHDMAFHIATADPNLVGKGIMSTWMRRLAEGVLAAEPECRRLMCDPDYRNGPMRRALEKIGWQLLGEFDIRPDRRIALYTLPREPADLAVLR